MAVLEPVHWQVVTPAMREVLRFIAQQIPLLTLLQLGETKYPYARDFELMAIESLVLFENADRDIQPALLVAVAWEEVRQFFIDQAQALGQIWFGTDAAEDEA